MSNDTETPRLERKYREQIVPTLQREFKYVNVVQIPGLTKIMVGMGIGEVTHDSKITDGAVRDPIVITGQKPTIIGVRKSITQLKLYEDMPIGRHVTLHGNRMWEFADRLPTLALSRIRNFRGPDDCRFDGKGNYTFGLNEQVMFLEIGQGKINRIRGIDIMFVTSATNNRGGRVLLRHLGLPFKAVGDPKPVKGGRGPTSQPREKR